MKHNITVNGKAVVWDEDWIGYTQICHLAGYYARETVTVIYHGKKFTNDTGTFTWAGTITLGESVKVEDGLRITAIITGNA